MTDEERKAIEYLKENPICRIEYDEFGNEKIVAYGSAFKYIILNLINKQEKAIDRMVGIIDSTYFEREEFEKWFENKILPKDEFGLFDYKERYIREPIIKEYFMEDKE